MFLQSARLLICREVQVNLAYRWFCKLGIEDAIPDRSAFSRARNERFRDGEVFRCVFERVVEACIAAGFFSHPLTKKPPPIGDGSQFSRASRVRDYLNPNRPR
jgi:hypothetical protein